MRVTDYSIAQQYIYKLNQNSSTLTDVTNELSSGQKLTKSSDDPSEVSTVFNYESQLRQNVQYTDNLTRASDISTATYSKINSIRGFVTTAEELGVTTDGLTNTDVYPANATKLNGLIEQAIDIANSKYSGEYIFGGTKSDVPPFTVTTDDETGDITGVTYTGSATTASFQVSDGITLSPYSTGAENTALADTINNMIKLRDAFTAKNTTDIQTHTAALGTNEDVMVAQLSRLGSDQSRIETLQGLVTNTSQNLYSTISGKADTNVAEATVRYNMASNAYTAAIQAGSKLLSTSLLDYL